MRITYILIFIALTADIAGARQFIASEAHATGDYKLDYMERTLIVTGTGASTKNQRTIADKKTWAITEARKNAISNAALAMGAVTVSGKTLLNSGRMESTSFSIKLRRWVRGIKETEHKTETLDDGSIFATVRMLLRFDGDNGLNQLMVDQMLEVGEISLADKPVKSIVENKQVDYSGIVFNLENLPIEPSMNPKVYSESGKILYGSANFSREYLLKYGIVGYAKNLGDVKDRIGERPFIINAVALKDNDKTSIIISESESVKLMKFQNSDDLLSKCKVVFLIK